MVTYVLFGTLIQFDMNLVFSEPLGNQVYFNPDKTQIPSATLCETQHGIIWWQRCDVCRDV